MLHQYTKGFESYQVNFFTVFLIFWFFGTHKFCFKNVKLFFVILRFFFFILQIYSCRFALFHLKGRVTFKTIITFIFFCDSGKDAIQPLEINVSFMIQPGIYEIRDIENNKSYYGESSNLADRIAMHYRFLSSGKHDNKKLQQAYNNLADKKSFQFIVLHAGSEWLDSQKRKKTEQDYISANKDRTYNFTDSISSDSGVIKPFFWYGEIFESTRSAVKSLKEKEDLGLLKKAVSRTEIKRQLDDPQNPNAYYIVEAQSPFGCTPIFGQKDNGPSVLFESMKACVDAGYATNVQNARRKIQRNEPGWRYAHLDENNSPIRKPYKLKPGEISYDDYIQQKQKNLAEE